MKLESLYTEQTSYAEPVKTESTATPVMISEKANVKMQLITKPKTKSSTIKLTKATVSALDNFSIGQLKYKVSPEMRVGKTYIASILIGSEQGLSNYTTGFVKEVTKVYPYMSCNLIGDKKDFEITPLSDENQIMSQVTTWNFNVKPLSAGKKKLNLKVSARIHIEGKDEFMTYPLVERTILVKVSIYDVLINLLVENWKAVVAFVFSSGFVGILLKRYKRKIR
jgi:hypothetical protein